jgi:hypothetical protein
MSSPFLFTVPWEFWLRLELGVPLAPRNYRPNWGAPAALVTVKVFRGMKNNFAILAFALCAGSLRVSADQVALRQPTATYSQSLSGDFSVAKAVNGSVWDGLGWGIQGQIGAQTAVFETAPSAGFGGGSLVNFQLSQTFAGWPQHTLGRFRLSVTTDDRSTFADGLSVNGDVSANWVVLRPHWLHASNGTILSRLDDDSILASGVNADTDTYFITAGTFLTGITGVRLEVIPDGSLPFGGPGRQPLNGNFVLSEFEVGVSAVPEPATWALMCLAGLFGFAMKRQSGSRPV